MGYSKSARRIFLCLTSFKLASLNLPCSYSIARRAINFSSYWLMSQGKPSRSDNRTPRRSDKGLWELLT